MIDWINWSGGECPVHKNTVVDVRYRSGAEEWGLVAGVDMYGRDWDASSEFWKNDGAGNDIVAYRLSKVQQSTLEEAYEDADRSISDNAIRTFPTGATRNLDIGKLDYEGFLSPLVIERFAEYMHKNRLQADGKVRESDNWQKGMPKDSYIKSGWRHFFDWWKEHRGCGVDTSESLEESICALIFNAQGYLHEHLKNKGN